MKKYNVGFIGSGKMASAIIKGVLKSEFLTSENLLATQAETDGLTEKSAELGIRVILDNKELVQKSDVIFIATKPNQVEGVLQEIKPFVTAEKLIVSIAAGVRTEKFESNLNENCSVIRVMPNTPALVNEGMSAICKGSNVSDEELEFVKELLLTVGKCIIVEEEQMDIVTAVSGSGPAFFYKVMNDIARAGEKLGLEYEKSLLLSIQTAIGSAKMALNRTVSMEELIGNVATKGGCTRVGVDKMEEAEIDKVLYEVISSTTEKARQLG